MFLDTGEMHEDTIATFSERRDDRLVLTAIRVWGH